MVNCDYCYSDDDILQLLRVRLSQETWGWKQATGMQFCLVGIEGMQTLPEEQSTQRYHVAITPAVHNVVHANTTPVDYFLNKATQAGNNGKDVFDELAVWFLSKEECYVKILFPFNLESVHWLTGEIQIHKIKHYYQVQMFLHDPYGGGQFDGLHSNKIEQAIRLRCLGIDAFAHLTFNNSISLYPSRQSRDDHRSCGVIVVDEICKRAEGALLTLIHPHPYGAISLREAQLGLVQGCYDIQILTLVSKSALISRLTAISSPRSSSPPAPYRKAELNIPDPSKIHHLLDDEYVFSENSLRRAVSVRVAPTMILTPQEEAQIIEANAQLSNLFKSYTMIKTSYSIFLRTHKEGVSKMQPSTLQSMRENCNKLQKKALEYIDFLAALAAKLFYARAFDRAQILYQNVLDLAGKMDLSKNIEILSIKSEYGATKISNLSSRQYIEEGKSMVESVVEELEPKLCSPTCDNNVKKIIAIADYTLAQYYNHRNNFAAADKHIKRSEQLRKEYHAPESELDKIQFFHGHVAYRAENFTEAERLLTECYNFRNSKNKYDPNLIPVLGVLADIQQKQRKTGKQMLFLEQLLQIQISHKVNVRDIITTQLQMLGAMMFRTSDKEYWDVMEDVEKKLNTIPVTAESVEVGLNYGRLADIRSRSVLSEDWSNTKKRDYHYQTLLLVVKAQMHLQTAKNKNEAEVVNGTHLLSSLKKRCQMLIDFFSDPAATIADDMPLHPEDQETLEALEMPSNVGESTTERELDALSKFSSEARHSLVDPADRLLTIQEFELLPETGRINPYKLRLAQGGINATFRDGRSLSEMKQLLIDNPDYTNNIPEVEIGIYEEKVFSFDTRRVIIHQQAREENKNILIRYKKIAGQHLQNRVESIFSPRPWNGIVTAVRYGGKGSESVPYINPPLRPQLEASVSSTFQSYPSTRENADPNGFPIMKKEAEKIYNFLVKKKTDGSERAKSYLKRLNEIQNIAGKEAAYNYLIGLKKALQKDSLLF